MDIHINLSFCTFNGFKILASSYLDVQSHPLFEPIEHLLDKLQVTPAVLAEELMKGEDVDIVLTGLVNFLEQKEIKGGGMNDVIDENEIPLQRSKKMKIDVKERAD